MNNPNTDTDIDADIDTGTDTSNTPNTEDYIESIPDAKDYLQILN